MINLKLFVSLEIIMITIQHKILYSPLFTDDGGWWMLEAGGWLVESVQGISSVTLPNTRPYHTFTQTFTPDHNTPQHILHIWTVISCQSNLTTAVECPYVSPSLCHQNIKTFSQLFTIELATPNLLMSDITDEVSDTVDSVRDAFNEKKSPYGGTLSHPQFTPSPPSKLGNKIEGTFI